MDREKVLHVVCFTIPWPANFGGAIDLFYKINALHQAGVKIILHAFVYSRSEAPMLEQFCSRVYYYRRDTGIISQLSRLPYIVKSRKKRELLDNLIKDDYPILFEGTHTTAWLNHPLLSGRVKWVRAHNVEHLYYRSLARVEKALWKRIFFSLEAYRLKRYETSLSTATGVMAISRGDEAFWCQLNPNTHLVTAFHGHTELTIETGRGDYVMYHGDLTVAENTNSAEWALKLCNQIQVPLIIAGKKPSSDLARRVLESSYCQLVSNPDDAKMLDLIRNASVILLPAKQTTGLRLKLLVSLFVGRHCIVSPEMVDNTGLEQLCVIAGSDEEWGRAVKAHFNRPFGIDEVDLRWEHVAPFLDSFNVQKMIRLIWVDK